MVLRFLVEIIAIVVAAFVIIILALRTDFTHLTFTAPLLQTVNGSVGHGNFTYWKLSRVGDFDGPLIIELISHSGDADLYVSRKDRPGFEADRNDFSSVTCGVDEVRIPEDFPRPITIGVYGYSISEANVYTLRIYYDVITATENLKAKLNIDWSPGIILKDLLLQKPAAENDDPNGDGATPEVSKVKLYVRDEPEEEVSVWRKTSKLMGLLSLVDTLFELFFL